MGSTTDLIDIDADNPTQVSALLLDFGGVIFRGGMKRENGVQGLADSVNELLKSTGNAMPKQRLIEDIDAARKAYKGWKLAETRRFAPREVTHQEFWGDFIAGSWPANCRVTVIQHASALMSELQLGLKIKQVQAGMPELLEAAHDAGVKLGIVSNTLCGSANRQLLEQHGLSQYVDAHVYSDEVGLRKPNPAIFGIAADWLGVDLAASWYVGDQYDRDVVGARRAGVGRVVVMRADERSTTPEGAEHRPDAAVDDGWGLLELLDARSRAPA